MHPLFLLLPCNTFQKNVMTKIVLNYGVVYTSKVEQVLNSFAMARILILGSSKIKQQLTKLPM